MNALDSSQAESYTRLIATPKTFSMTLMPYVDAVLVFDASDAEETGQYDVFSITPADRARTDFWREWENIREALTPTGRIPTSDVEFDEATGFRIRTLGIERFATAA